MLDYVLANWWLSGLLFYVPLALCLYGYSVKTWRDYRKDSADRDDPKYGHHYQPTLTLGTILGRLFVTAFPIANLLAAIFDIGPEVFGDFFRWLGRAFDFPLVPKRAKPE